MKKLYAPVASPPTPMGCRRYQAAVFKCDFRARSLVRRWPQYSSFEDRAPQYSSFDNDYGHCGTLFMITNPN